MTRAELEALVPPLRGCALCAHSMERDGTLHCYAPAVRIVFGVQPVAMVRRLSEACGPSATHMYMPAWGEAA